METEGFQPSSQVVNHPLALIENCPLERRGFAAGDSLISAASLGECCRVKVLIVLDPVWRFSSASCLGFWLSYPLFGLGFLDRAGMNDFSQGRRGFGSQGFLGWWSFVESCS